MVARVCSLVVKYICISVQPITAISIILGSLVLALQYRLISPTIQFTVCVCVIWNCVYVCS